MGHFEELAQNAREERRRTLIIGAFVAFVFGMLTFSYFFLYEPPFRYGEEKRAILHLADELKIEPCTRETAVRFAELLNKAGDYPRTLQENARFYTQCGEYDRLLWTDHAAHQNLAQWDAAISIATKLMAQAPQDLDFRWWRSKDYLAKGDFKKAIADLRECQDKNSFAKGSPFTLATALEKDGRYCEALFPIRRYLAVYPRQNEKQQQKIRERLEFLARKGKCQTLISGGNTQIPFEKDDNKHTLLAVHINKIPLVMRIETRVPYTLLDKEQAQKSELKMTREKVWIESPKNVFTEAELGFAQIQIGSLSVQNVEVAIVEKIEQPVLGFSFFSRFNVDRPAPRDTEQNKMQLSPRSP